MAAARLLITTTCAMLLALAAGCRSEEHHRVTIRGETFPVELAITDEEVQRGMMGREEFPFDGNGGMLFVFSEPGFRSFWMKDCIIDIDLLFLDSAGVVTTVHRMKAEPPRRDDETEGEYESRLKSYPSRRPSQFAIELPAGTIDRLGVRVDDRVELDLKRLKALAR